MSHRFFVEQPVASDSVLLTGPEAHHLCRVMRLQAGDCVVLFDGSGSEFAATVQSVSKQQVQLGEIERREVNRELPLELTVAVALPKGDRQKWLVEKLVELGAKRLIPLETARGVAQPVEKAVARLERSVIEASKQCERNCLMEIGKAVACEAFFGGQQADLRLIAHPGGQAWASIVDCKPSSLTLAIGPEGGFTDDEVRAAQSAGWLSVGLGPRILRVETAAIALCSAAAILFGVDRHGPR